MASVRVALPIPLDGRCAATGVKVLKAWEKHWTKNGFICRYFVNFGNLQKTIVLLDAEELSGSNPQSPTTCDQIISISISKAEASRGGSFSSVIPCYPRGGASLVG